MKVWITKYALTKGVFSVDGEVKGSYPSMVRYGSAFNAYAHGNDWHRTHSDAIDRAEDMREAKLKSLAKQIKKLQALDLTREVQE